MGFKWLLVWLMVFFAAVAYYRDDLAQLGGTEGTEAGELESLNSVSPRRPTTAEPSTKQWY